MGRQTPDSRFTGRSFPTHLGTKPQSETCQNRIETRQPTSPHQGRETVQVVIKTGTEIAIVTANGIAMVIRKDKETGIAEAITRVVVVTADSTITPKAAAEPQG